MRRKTVLNLLELLLLPTAALSAADAVPDADQLFETLDANGDGILAGDEIGKAQQKAFNRLLRVGDANDDGQLTRQEYAAGLKPESQKKPDGSAKKPARPRSSQPGVNVDRLFERLDRNSDGKIALDEVPDRLIERLQPIFDRIGKEELTRADFETFRRSRSGGPALPPGGGRPQIALIKLLDADDNGQLSQEELSKLEEKFSELDRNGDGQLAPRELFGFGGGPMAAGKEAGKKKNQQADKAAQPAPE